MKGFFKKHPELLILLIVVIVVDALIVWMWLDDLAATDKAQKDHERIENNAKKINNSDWLINRANADKAKAESVRWEKAFDELIARQQEKYLFTIDYKRSDQSATAKRVLKTKVDYLSQELLKDKDKTNKLSFSAYAYDNTLLDMKKDDIESVFVIFKGMEEIVESCVKADIVSLDSVDRPGDLSFEEDAVIGTKRYTYVLTVSATAEGFKKLVNELVNNDKFFFEINSLKLEAVRQISSTGSDHIPLVQRKGTTSAIAPKGRGLRRLEDDIERLADPGNGNAAATDPDEPVIYKDSVSPFSQAINKVVISLDWVQFIKPKPPEDSKKGKR